ncbi:Pr6Pr family membrane protein [Leifsonia sp. ZF2019]|uniref:Pr6Pr family membrane protein n=1 Tax=Leifsonia sp. ZF2019 TaxID=2781978 RepID=UPI001CBB2CC2|nr:Pr6Pr family membrane protein [Leifsonia sp. ZF2019]UAJ79487.1 Pr6Pr family membrane protein [Leifsonia sp. ZF2019]
MRIGFGALRAVMALVTLAAIIAQLASSIAQTSRAGGSVPGLIANFLSFFTIDSNVATVVVLAIGAVLLFGRSGDDPAWFTALRAAVVTYMVTTGVVYNLLLRNIALPQGQTVAWSNEVLHVIAPLYMLLDWLLAPGRAPLRRRVVWGIAAFPIVWAVYTLLRAPIAAEPTTGRQPWYPYPFLNPATSANGYLSVAFYIVLIAAVILCTGYGVVWVSRRWRGSRPLPVDADAP